MTRVYSAYIFFMEDSNYFIIIIMVYNFVIVSLYIQCLKQ